MSVIQPAYGTYAALTVTNLQSLANDATDVYAGWQSDIIDNRTTKALDYWVQVRLPTAASAPANDQAAYVYVVPWTHTGGAWVPGANFGTTTLPTGSEATANMSDPNSMGGPIYVPYKITSQVLSKGFSIANTLGAMPQGFSLAIRNATGAALSTGCVVEVMPLTATSI